MLSFCYLFCDFLSEVKSMNEIINKEIKNTKGERISRCISRIITYQLVYVLEGELVDDL